jgi:DHA1 family bicyclomycin/chloramphenicol resistance-like MFS transporter
VLTILLLPSGHRPDPSVSLKPRPILLTFFSVLKNPQFYTYCFAGAFSAATLFIYVAGSPVVFMEIFHVSPRAYGGIFALLSVSFIGANQLNIILTRRFSSQRIFQVALSCQLVVSLVFLVGGWNGGFDLAGTIIMFFLALGCLGFCSPNGNALALAPLNKNLGSASALLACTQIGVAALASSGVAIFSARDLTPVAGLMAGTCAVAWIILRLGRIQIGENLAEATDAGPAAH